METVAAASAALPLEANPAADSVAHPEREAMVFLDAPAAVGPVEELSAGATPAPLLVEISAVFPAAVPQAPVDLEAAAAAAGSGVHPASV